MNPLSRNSMQPQTQQTTSLNPFTMSPSQAKAEVERICAERGINQQQLEGLIAQAQAFMQQAGIK